MYDCISGHFKENEMQTNPKKKNINFFWQLQSSDSLTPLHVLSALASSPGTPGGCVLGKPSGMQPARGQMSSLTSMGFLQGSEEGRAASDTHCGGTWHSIPLLQQ